MEYNEEHHAHFEEHGYVRLGRVLDDAGLAELQQRIDAIMLGEIPYPEMEFQLDGEDADYAKMPTVSTGHKGTTLQYRKIMGLEQDPVYLAYMQHPLFRQITRRYIGEDVSIFRAMFMNKPAEKGTILPWHQDVGVGWGVDYNPTTTVWTAIDPATVANGCMQVVPGSHKHGVITEGHFPSAEQLPNTRRRARKSTSKPRPARRFCSTTCCCTARGPIRRGSRAAPLASPIWTGPRVPCARAKAIR